MDVNPLNLFIDAFDLILIWAIPLIVALYLASKMLELFGIRRDPLLRMYEIKPAWMTTTYAWLRPWLMPMLWALGVYLKDL